MKVPRRRLQGGVLAWQSAGTNVPGKRPEAVCDGVDRAWILQRDDRDAHPSAPHWRAFDQVRSTRQTTPVAVAGALLVGTTQYGPSLLSPRNGRVIDAVDLGSGFAEAATAFGGHTYLLSNLGTIFGVVVEPRVDRTPSLAD
jgi:hypothetical protein